MKYKLPDHKSIMGILNVTPDSFYDGGKYKNTTEIINRIKQMIEQGVDIIDIGAESTRPGSKAVSLDEELRRLTPVISEIRKFSDIPISIDTTKADVIKELIKYNIQIVNDVSAGSDNEIINLARENQLYISLMHMQNNPLTMQDKPEYDNLIADIFSFLKNKYQNCVNLGINPSKIIIDPGFGFGKTIEHNFTILKNLDVFKKISENILVGISRKSMIGAVTGKEPNDRLHGSIAAESIAIFNGARIIRVHDIEPSVLMRNVIEKMCI